MTYKEVYEYGKQKLIDAGIEDAVLDARLLLEYICHTDRNELIVHADCQRSSMEEQFYKIVIEKEHLIYHYSILQENRNLWDFPFR